MTDRWNPPDSLNPPHSLKHLSCHHRCTETVSGVRQAEWICYLSCATLDEPLLSADTGYCCQLPCLEGCDVCKHMCAGRVFTGQAVCQSADGLSHVATPYYIWHNFLLSEPHAGLHPLATYQYSCTPVEAPVTSTASNADTCRT